ncbi:MAG: mutarotase [Breznakibacter sp.]
MNLRTHYDALYQNAVQKIESNGYSLDDLIDSPDDQRRGITLLIRPKEKVRLRIRQFLNELRLIEPKQYYQPDPDIHVTVLSIISCHPGFELQNICVSDYIDLIGQTIKAASPFKIRFNGVTASPSCIMVQGFPTGNTLNDVRDRLRDCFNQSGLQQSIDSRYSIQTAHMTVVRFREPLVRINEFLKVVERYRNFDFGTLSIDSIELVYNDWYQRNELVKELHRFKLAGF